MISIQEVIYRYQFNSGLEYIFSKSVFSNILNPLHNLFSIPVNPDEGISAGDKHNIFIGISNVTSISLATSQTQLNINNLDNLDKTVIANVISATNADIDVLAIGIEHPERINTGSGSDNIIGVANAFGWGNATAIAHSSSFFNRIPTNDTSSLAKVNVIVDAIGISNPGIIDTGKGNDTIIGISRAVGFGVGAAISRNQLVSESEVSGNISSKSSVLVETGAIGIDNINEIFTGKGNDIIFGLAITRAEAMGFATSIAKALINHGHIPNNIENVTSFNSTLGTSTVVAETKTNAWGIINHSVIDTGQGQDTIVGMASNQSFSQALAQSEAISNLQDIALAQINASSKAVSQSDVVGIFNRGSINTGRGNDNIIGIALNASGAVANADADLTTFAADSDSQSNTNSLADASLAISIGIDNISGVIATGAGDDQILGFGKVGITGGVIATGAGDDQLLAYGDLVGIENSEIILGEGDDYFQAALANVDPFALESVTANNSASIKNAVISGGQGNDIFEIESFAEMSSIDAGNDYDVLKLSGNIENYQITQGSSENQTLTIQDVDSILIAKNIESFYFGNDDFFYSFDDFA